MGLFDRGYDRDFDRNYRYPNQYPEQYTGRSYWSGSGDSLNSRYGSDYDRGVTGWSAYPYYSRSNYGEEYRGPGYDRYYRNRWQTDYGDPFGDRVQQTPIRVIRGQPRRYDRGFVGDGRERRERYPFGYVPYDQRAGYDAGYRHASARGAFGRRYERDWY